MFDQGLLFYLVSFRSMRVVGRAQQLIRIDGLYNPLFRFIFFISQPILEFTTNQNITNLKSKALNLGNYLKCTSICTQRFMNI